MRSTSSMRSIGSMGSMSSTGSMRSKGSIKVHKRRLTTTRTLDSTAVHTQQGVTTEQKSKTSGVSKSKLGQLFTKNNFVVFVSTILFIGCTAFVAFRGYRCFDKYFKKPEHTEISYKSSKNHPFPSFTLCASPDDSYNDDQMRECQLETNDYIIKGPWVGKGGVNCTNPKILHNQAAANCEDLKVGWILIHTYAGEDSHFIQPSLIEWKLALVDDLYKRCFTFTIPDNILREGIQRVQIHSKPFDLLYLHKEGTLSAAIPGSSLSAKYADLYDAFVTHESIELLNYDGKNCNNDGEYNYDKCKQDYIYKVY